jgi:small subunit ribosomal protein S20
LVVKGSAAKRYRQSEKRRVKNKSVRSEIRTSAKRVLDAVSSQDRAAADKEFRGYSALIDSAARKGVYHQNTAARKKSRMAHKVNGIQS